MTLDKYTNNIADVFDELAFHLVETSSSVILVREKVLFFPSLVYHYPCC